MKRHFSDQEVRRREELHALREAGIEPYPAHGWTVTAGAADVVASYDAETTVRMTNRASGGPSRWRAA
jgi:lysyl-tRNA synthetase, class II